MKYLLQAVFYLFLAAGLLLLAYDHFALYQKFAVERRERLSAQENETSLRMERDNLLVYYRDATAYIEELQGALSKCVSPVVSATDSGNPMPGFSRADALSLVKKGN